MAIDITRAAFAGNVLKDEVILAHANCFAPTYVDYTNNSIQDLSYGSHDSVDVCYTPRNEGSIEAFSKIKQFQGFEGSWEEANSCKIDCTFLYVSSLSIPAL